MADMGIYSLWPVFTGLGLGSPISAEAWATHTCSIIDGVSRPAVNDFSYPTACTLRFKLPPRKNSPSVELFWYDGGMKPRLPEALEALAVEMPREGILFIGDQGAIMAGFQGQSPRRFAQGKCQPLETKQATPQGERRPDREAGDQYLPWIEAVRGGAPSPGSFTNAGPISDAVTLGTVALRSGKKVQFDSENMKITNVPEANKLLHREYRKGWEL
jgi:hypothetical protein